jgi:hypothetical protein
LAGGEMLRAVLARLEVIGGASNREFVDAFHPECRDPQAARDVIEEYERSLNRLGEQAGVMGELARIIAERPQAALVEYPLRFQVLFHSMCIMNPAANKEDG